MIPIVNDKFRYIVFYNPKSACSFIRKLYLHLHHDEFLDKEASQLNEWHNLSDIRFMKKGKDYSDYYKFTLVRHPLTRLVSSYLNRVVRHAEDDELIKQTLKSVHGNDYVVTFSFNQFLEFLQNVSFEGLVNDHFLPQSQFSNVPGKHLRSSQYFSEVTTKNKWFLMREKIIHLDKVCKMETLNKDVMDAYQMIFVDYPEKQADVMQFVQEAQVERLNASLVSDDFVEGAADMSRNTLLNMNKMPNYASFLATAVSEQCYAKYALDFDLFSYTKKLDEVLRFESDKSKALYEMIPESFSAMKYLELNPELLENGISTSGQATLHWLEYGRFENRQYK